MFGKKKDVKKKVVEKPKAKPVAVAKPPVKASVPEVPKKTAVETVSNWFKRPKWLTVTHVATVNNNAAILMNDSGNEVRELAVEISYHTIMGKAVNQRISEFYEADDDRMISRPICPNLLLPGQRLRFRLLQKRNVLGGECHVKIDGKLVNGESVSNEEKLTLIV